MAQPMCVSLQVLLLVILGAGPVGAQSHECPSPEAKALEPRGVSGTGDITPTVALLDVVTAIEPAATSQPCDTIAGGARDIENSPPGTRRLDLSALRVSRFTDTRLATNGPRQADAAGGHQQPSSWQQRYDEALARKRRGDAMFWGGSAMLYSGIALSFVPANTRYCYSEYPVSECAKRVVPLLAADVVGAVLMGKGAKVRSKAKAELAALERERSTGAR